MVCQSKVWLSYERGQSATEVLLSLPFLVLVMLLGINFGKAFLIRQRAVVGARYAAWHEVRTGTATSSDDMQKAGYGGDQMSLTTLASGDARAGAIRDMELAGGSDSRYLSSSWAGLKGGTAYGVSYSWRPLGKVLGEARPSAEHYIVAEDWRHKDGETGFLSGIGSLFGGVGQFLGGIF